MSSLKLSVLDAFDELRASGLARPAAEKFAGAWLACFLVMARGNIFAAFSLEHMLLATVCGSVGAAMKLARVINVDRAAPMGSWSGIRRLLALISEVTTGSGSGIVTVSGI